MDLWAELQATKDTLRITEEEMATYKMEKIRFLESLTKIAVNINVHKSLNFKLFHGGNWGYGQISVCDTSGVAKQIKFHLVSVLHTTKILRFQFKIIPSRVLIKAKIIKKLTKWVILGIGEQSRNAAKVNI